MNYGIAVTRVTELLDGTPVNDVYLQVGGNVGGIECAKPLSHKRLYSPDYVNNLSSFCWEEKVGQWLCNEDVWMHPKLFEQMQVWLSEEFR